MKEPLAIQIFRAREHLGLTQDQLATLAGVGGRTISSYETGRHLPRPEVLGRLSEALGVPLSLPIAAAPSRPAAKRSAASVPARPAARRVLKVRPTAACQKGWPTREELAARAAEIRQETLAVEVGNYIRLLDHREDGMQGDLIVYSIRIAVSKPLSGDEALRALRTHLGDPCGCAEANELEIHQRCLR